MSSKPLLDSPPPSGALPTFSAPLSTPLSPSAANTYVSSHLSRNKDGTLLPMNINVGSHFRGRDIEVRYLFCFPRTALLPTPQS